MALGITQGGRARYAGSRRREGSTAAERRQVEQVLAAEVALVGQTARPNRHPPTPALAGRRYHAALNLTEGRDGADRNVLAMLGSTLQAMPGTG
jgi:hypothetical protein